MTGALPVQRRIPWWPPAAWGIVVGAALDLGSWAIDQVGHDETALDLALLAYLLLHSLISMLAVVVAIAAIDHRRGVARGRSCARAACFVAGTLAGGTLLAEVRAMYPGQWVIRGPWDQLLVNTAIQWVVGAGIGALVALAARAGFAAVGWPAQAKTGHPPSRWLRLMARGGLGLVACGVVTCIAILVIRHDAQTHPLLKLLRGFGQKTRVPAWLLQPAPTGGLTPEMGYGSWQPAGGGYAIVLAIPASDHGGVRAQLQLAMLVPVSGGAEPVALDPLVCCDLGPDEARAIEENGLPDTLVQEMIAVGDQCGSRVPGAGTVVPPIEIRGNQSSQTLPMSLGRNLDAGKHLR